jgi:hypothetical protein
VTDPFATADPFATTAVVAAGDPIPNNENTTKDNTKLTVEKTTLEQAFTGTFKEGPGYEASWLVIRGDSPYEYAANVEAAMAQELFELNKKAAAVFRGGSFKTPAPNTAAPAAPVVQATGSGKSCAHGAMTLRSGGGGDTGKKAWRGHFCPQPKGSSDQCSPIWG